MIENLDFQDPMDEMERRWERKVESALPALDLHDLTAQRNPRNLNRQFAPEFSQASYETLLRQDYAIGDYINLQASPLGTTEETRQHMVTLLIELNRLK